MTDITELAQRMKAAAEKATPGGWCIDDYHGVIADAGLNGNYYIASCSGPDHRSNKRFIALANPANVLALVEALEKAQQRNGELETYSKTAIEFREAARDENRHLKLELEIAEKRIAELEEAEQKLCAANVTLDARADLAERQLAAMDSEPVAWDYEWASCITCEGPQNFNRVIEREAPPEWSIEEGQAKNIIPLYRHAQPAPVVSDGLLSMAASAIEDLLEHTDPNTSYYSGVWADVPGKLRAAMIAAAPQEVKGE
ncbi:ead/Ea22-like family protein [Raoultella planticola]|uniref:ead/Ea22-like family protein n=1 Tax=Raoultella planticola TaxID=575 RepID=UPI0031BAC585